MSEKIRIGDQWYVLATSARAIRLSTLKPRRRAWLPPMVWVCGSASTGTSSR